MVSSKTHRFSQRLWRWLERLGFEDEPFALYEADKEREFLNDFFVDRPYLHDIIGNPAHPQIAFLMAGRGRSFSVKATFFQECVFYCEPIPTASAPFLDH